MFPRDRRVRTTSDIITALRKGRRFSFGPVSCYFFSKPGSVGKATVIVDKKTAKKAVQRNLMKRRSRAILQQYPLPAGNLVVRLYAGSQDLSFPDLHIQLERCLAKLS